MPTYLGPAAFKTISQKYGLTPQNESKYVTRTAKGIFLNDNVDPNGPATAGNDPGTMDHNTELWQMLNGGQLADNPYLPYLQPRVIEQGGKKFLRIPKNQQLVDLAKYFDSRGKTQFDNSSSFVNDYLKWQSDQQRLSNETAKTQYDINKPYYNPSTRSAAVTSKSRANAYDANGKQIGFAIYDPKTAQTSYVNLGGNMELNPEVVASVGSTPKSAVDPNVRTDLVSDIQAGHPLADLYSAYPEISPSEIKAIYDNVGQ